MGPDKNNQPQICSIVDRRADTYEEKNQRPKKKISGTTNNNGLTYSRKNQYQDGKLQYQAEIKREKFKSWK